MIACPHALGLAIPLVVSIATERAARGGVLVKDRLALESMRTVDAVLFDKTGTLTKGEPVVIAVEPSGDLDADTRAGARRCRRSRQRAPAREGDRPRGGRSRARCRRRRPDSRRPLPWASPPRSVTGVIRVGGPRLLDEIGAGEIGAAHAWRERRGDHPARRARRSGRRRTRARRRGACRVAAGRRRAPRARHPGRDDHRRRRSRRSVGRPRSRRRPCLRRCAARGQVRRRSPNCSAKARRSRWSATESTTRRRSRRPMSASRSAPAPTSRSPRPV